MRRAARPSAPRAFVSTGVGALGGVLRARVAPASGPIDLWFRRLGGWCDVRGRAGLVRGGRCGRGGTPRASPHPAAPIRRAEMGRDARRDRRLGRIGMMSDRMKDRRALAARYDRHPDPLFPRNRPGRDRHGLDGRRGGWAGQRAASPARGRGPAPPAEGAASCARRRTASAWATNAAAFAASGGWVPARRSRPGMRAVGRRRSSARARCVRRASGLSGLVRWRGGWGCAGGIPGVGRPAGTGRTDEGRRTVGWWGGAAWTGCAPSIVHAPGGTARTPRRHAPGRDDGPGGPGGRPGRAGPSSWQGRRECVRGVVPLAGYGRRPDRRDRPVVGAIRADCGPERRGAAWRSAGGGRPRLDLRRAKAGSGGAGRDPVRSPPVVHR